MEKQRMMTSSAIRKAGRHRLGRSPGEKSYMRFRCVRCDHCVSPGMFTNEGWAIYKKTELCPECQEIDSAAA